MKGLPFHGKYVFCISEETQCSWHRLSPTKWRPFVHHASYTVRQEDNKLTQENPRLKARVPFKRSVSLILSLLSYWVEIVHMSEKKEKMFIFDVPEFTVHNAMGSVSCQQF